MLVLDRRAAPVSILLDLEVVQHAYSSTSHSELVHRRPVVSLLRLRRSFVLEIFRNLLERSARAYPSYYIPFYLGGFCIS